MSTHKDKTMDNFIADLRAQGLSKMDSVKEVATHFQLDFKSASMTVHNSPTWNDVKERDEALNDQFMDAFEAFAKENG